MKKKHTKKWVVDGVKVEAVTSSSSWYYAGYPLKVIVKLKNGSRCIVESRKRYVDADNSDFDELCDMVEVVRCAEKGCNEPPACRGK